MTTTVSPSIFYKLPNSFIRRHSFSSNTNHFVYREINNHPEIMGYIRHRIKETIMDMYEVVEEQHTKRHKNNSSTGLDLSLIQKMFPTELVNPEKYKQEQEQKEWEREQNDRLAKWKETQKAKQLAKEFLEKETHIKIPVVSSSDLDKKESESTKKHETTETETPVVVHKKRVVSVSIKTPICKTEKIKENNKTENKTGGVKEHKTRIYKITSSIPNQPVVVKRIVINKPCSI